MRLLAGAGVSLIGLALAAMTWLHWLGGPWGWIVAGVTLAAGLFQIYEGWSGWCALRAMGVKTPF